MIKASIYQKRFWLEWRSGTTGSSYNEGFVFDVAGNFNEERFFVALRQVVLEHASLRSYFSEKDADLYLVIAQSKKLSVIRQEVERLSQKHLNDFTSEILAYKFNLYEPPLFVIGLVKDNAGKARLVFCFHHIIMDGMSFSVFKASFARYYDSMTQVIADPRQSELSLTKMLMQEQIQGQTICEDKRYWLNYTLNE